MRINVTMVGLLMFPNQADTPWTNANLVSVPGYPYYNNNPLNPPTCLMDRSVTLFANTMNSLSLSFSYDYAVAVMK